MKKVLLVAVGVVGLGCGKSNLNGSGLPEAYLHDAPLEHRLLTMPDPITVPLTKSVDVGASIVHLPLASVNNLERAREAGLRGDYAAVRQLLEAKVRAGHGTMEEANLVRQSCKAMGDKACSDHIKAMYPNDESPPPPSAPLLPPPPTVGSPAVTPLERAREAALRGEYSTVRSLLEGRVRSGHATPDEARLVRAACKGMGDKTCVEDIKAKYPQ